MKTRGPLKPVGKRYPRGNLVNSSLRLVQLAIAVTPQDGHMDPHKTREISRPKAAHTQHLIQFLSLSVTSHWCSGVISASQFKQQDFFDGTGVKRRGAGEGSGRPFARGEKGDGEFSRTEELLRFSFSGDSTSLSLSPT